MIRLMGLARAGRRSMIHDTTWCVFRQIPGDMSGEAQEAEAGHMPPRCLQSPCNLFHSRDAQVVTKVVSGFP